MNLEKDCQHFVSSLNKDFTIGSRHLIPILFFIERSVMEEHY